MKITYRFSGHETFPCRYSWLPKAFRVLSRDPTALADDENAMVTLGVGKNMVRAIRFWVQVAGIADLKGDGGFAVTDFGNALLAHGGLDPFLEDICTLWLIHWRISTRRQDPLFAWDFLLNRWQKPDFDRFEIMQVFQREAERLDRKLSPVTLEQHFEVFLHTYMQTRSRKGDVREDNLDCPLVELQLIEKIGERKTRNGRLEPVYAFRRERKPEISPQVFLFCLQEFWSSRHANEKTVGFRDIVGAEYSPGQIFKLPEWDLRERLETIGADSNGLFTYQESAAFQRVTRQEGYHPDFLSQIYGSKEVYA